jgi:hypothetical protein
VLVVGCSGSSSTPPTEKVVSAVAETTQLTSLTTAEAKQYCDDLLAYNRRELPVSEATKLRCAVTALVATRGAADDTAARAACKQAYDACAAAPAPNAPTECDDKSIQQFASCKGVTVADSNACLREAHARQASFLAADICATITVAGIEAELSARNAQGPACRKLTTACAAN